MRALAVCKILIIAFMALALLIIVFDRMSWADRCERMGGVVYQSWFGVQQCVPNLNMELPNDYR